MSRPATNPSGATSDDAKAKAFFATCLTVGAGFAGLVVAGLVLGFDYLLHGEPNERERLAQQRADARRSRYDEALSWLEADRADRARYRRAVRDWFNADPATRGAKPSSEETVGRAFGRGWRNLLVGWRRFKTGWDQGRADAQQRRDDGAANWWQRPDASAAGTREPTEPPTNPPLPPATTPQPPEPVVLPADPPTRTPATAEDIVDVDIIPDPEPTSQAVVPVGDSAPQFQPDPALDDYQRRLNDLGTGQFDQDMHALVAHSDGRWCGRPGCTSCAHHRRSCSSCGGGPIYGNGMCHRCVWQAAAADPASRSTQPAEQ